MSDTRATPAVDFVRAQVQQDLETGRHTKITTRFPPEPNGYLHIGHAKSICLNFGIANEYQGICNLRFDDTNPEKEDVEYVRSIQEDIHWLGFDWEERLYHASDYFGRLYDCALQLIRNGKAYVCELNDEDIRRYRGTVKSAGQNSPNRERSIEENLDLFTRMRQGEFPDGAMTLRAKIDMAHDNMKMRDPLIYRIRHQTHHRSGDDWCIYPMYDYAHPLSDAFESITHSICTLEFDNNREVYDWFINELQDLLPSRPRQIEFARLNLTYTLMSKRKLLSLVKTQAVTGWDDPRMPTISGLRRRGYTPEAIRDFCQRIGVSKINSVSEKSLLEYCIRDDLNKRASRFMAVLHPLKIVITNYPENHTEELDAVNNPEDLDSGTRKVPFGRELYIEREDFMEDAPKNFFRLAPGKEVRLRWAYFICCEKVIKNESGEVTELHCTYDPQSKGGNAPDGRRVKGTIHWVSALHAVAAEVRLYEELFSKEDPEVVADSGDFTDNLNPDSLKILPGVMLEPALANNIPKETVQFERMGYFIADKDSSKDQPIFNRTVTLRDSWAKEKKKQSS